MRLSAGENNLLLESEAILGFRTGYGRVVRTGAMSCEFGIARQRGQCERRAERLLDLQRAVQTAHHHGLETIAVQREAENRRNPAFARGRWRCCTSSLVGGFRRRIHRNSWRVRRLKDRQLNFLVVRYFRLEQVG